jgi:F0F1-type ATP synthase assembly protein I
MAEDPKDPRSKPPPTPASLAGEWRQALWAMAAVVELTASILASAWIGLWLDRWFHTDPLFLLVFVLVGGGAGFWLLWRFTRHTEHDNAP